MWPTQQPGAWPTQQQQQQPGAWPTQQQQWPTQPQQQQQQQAMWPPVQQPQQPPQQWPAQQPGVWPQQQQPTAWPSAAVQQPGAWPTQQQQQQQWPTQPQQQQQWPIQQPQQQQQQWPQQQQQSQQWPIQQQPQQATWPPVQQQQQPTQQWPATQQPQQTAWPYSAAASSPPQPIQPQAEQPQEAAAVTAATGPVDVEAETRKAIEQLNAKEYAAAKQTLECVLSPAAGDPSFGPAMLLLRELRMIDPRSFPSPDPTDMLRQSLLALSAAGKQRTAKFLAECTAVPSSSSFGILAAAVWKNLQGDAESMREALELYQAAANHGNARAQCYLGFMRQNGLGGKDKDEDEALRLFTLAAQQGDAMATQCKTQLEQLAQQRAAQAQQALAEEQRKEAQLNPQLEKVMREAMAFMDTKQWVQAHTALDKASDRMFPPVLLLTRELWLAYPKAFGASASSFPTPAESLRRTVEMTPAAQRGRSWRFIQTLMAGGQQRPSPYAYLLAALWQDLVEENMSERVRFLKIASDLGLPRANFHLALCWMVGNGVEKVDAAEGMRLMVEAAGAGDAAALLYCATHLRENSRELLERAADAGSIEARGRLLLGKHTSCGSFSDTEKKLMDKLQALGGRNVLIEAEAEKLVKLALTAMDEGKGEVAVRLAARALENDRDFGIARCLAHEVRLSWPLLYSGPDRTLALAQSCKTLGKPQKERASSFAESLLALKPRSPNVALVCGAWCFMMAMVTKKGPTTSPSPPRNAFVVLKSAATALSSARAQCYTALFLLGELEAVPVVAKDEAAAVAMLRLAAAQNDMVAKYTLGMCLLNGVGVPEKSPAEAVGLLREAAQMNEARAQYQLGLCLQKAIGTAENWPEAHKWLESSVKLECPEAVPALAIIVELMRNREQENLVREAVQLLDKSIAPESIGRAKQLADAALALFENFVPAIILRRELHLALPRLFNEEPCPFDDETSAYPARIEAGKKDTLQFRDRAWQFLTDGIPGSAASSFALLLCALWKRDVESSMPEAAQLLREASSHGNARAQCTLGCWLMRGDEEAILKQDKPTAFNLLRDASAQDDSSAHVHFGDALLHASGTAREDFGGARRMYDRALSNGLPAVATDRLVRLDIEVALREAIEHFDAPNQLEKCHPALAKAWVLCKTNGVFFAPVWLLRQELRRTAPKLFAEEPDPDPKMPASKKVAEWARLFVEEVLTDARTRSVIGVVVAGMHRNDDADLFARSVRMSGEVATSSCSAGRALFHLAKTLLEGKNLKASIDLLRAAVEKGDLDSHFALSQLLLGKAEGLPVAEHNFSEGIRLLQAASDGELPEAQLQLGLCIVHNGIPGVIPEDPAMAAILFRRAAVRGVAEAQFELAVCLRDGWGTPEDWSEAKAWFTHCVENGFEEKGKPALDLHLEAMRNREQERITTEAALAVNAGQLVEAKRLLDSAIELFGGFVPGLLLLSEIQQHSPKLVGVHEEGVQIAQRIKASFEALSPEHAQRSASFVLGPLSERGGPAGSVVAGSWCLVCMRDPASAAKHFGAAAAADGAVLPRAHCRFGECLANGRGVAADVKLATKHLSIAAMRGDAAAQFVLATGIRDGMMSAPDPSTTPLSLLVASAGSGFAAAQLTLAKCFEQGGASGVVASQDMNEAVALYIAAAEQGEAEAQYHAGVNLLAGNGAEKDARRAVSFLNRASKQGHSLAQYRLGACLENGVGTGCDEGRAARLYEQAAAGGVLDAKRALAQLQAVWAAREAAQRQADAARAQEEAARAQERAADEARRASEKMQQLLNRH